MVSNKTIDNYIAESERIGVIGSPSTTGQIALDILANAVTRKLVGELALFRYLQDGNLHYALGQITEIAMRNIWHEDPTMRSLIRQHGRVDAVSERQDTHQGKMTISAVFAQHGTDFHPSILGTVPATGTHIHVVTNEILDQILSPYRSQLFYLGHVYGSSPKLPLWFKHFNSGRDGAGEAYHIGIFGKTGSGKSVLAKMALLAYARHKSMGLFVLDPQGEFAKDLRNRNPASHMGQIFNPNLLKGIGRQFSVYDLGRIQLDRWEVFRELLVEFGLFFALGIKSSQYQEAVADYAVDFLREKHTFQELDNIQVLVDILTHVSDNIHRIYSGQSGIDRVQGFIVEAIDHITQGSANQVKDKWDLIASFFRLGEGRRTAQQIVQEALQRREQRTMIVVDLSLRPSGIDESVWNDKIKPLIIDRFLNALIFEAERAYQDEKSLNTLVLIDEAHRLAPEGKIANERLGRIRSNLVDAVRTTRKYGLGWMFLSQTLSSLDSELVQQLRIFFFGFGLSMGTEYQKLRELVGGQTESMNLYQRFRDPQSAFDSASREYSFMTVGPVSPLSFSGTPLFLNAFNDVGQFLQANELMMQPKLF